LHFFYFELFYGYVENMKWEFSFFVRFEKK
jgi:hypothetical protein